MSLTGAKHFFYIPLGVSKLCVDTIPDEGGCILYLSGGISKNQNRAV